MTVNVNLKSAIKVKKAKILAQYFYIPLNNNESKSLLFPNSSPQWARSNYGTTYLIS